jgi:cation diffusion facilitator CzcD-associated flavoprotein CzcO
MAGMPHVLIVGTGFGGLAMALELARSGMRDFTLVERSSEVGGVWRENTYPGAACDIPSPYYSFSFAPNPDWPARFSLQPDIKAYLERIVDEYGLRGHIRFDTEIVAATFDEQRGQWHVETADGERITADVFVPATGQLSRPKLPDLPGIESFTGPAFHSATWDHAVELAGKRVAVVGTGASAVQFVPAIQPAVARLTVFQRSAPWLLPRLDRTYRRWHHTLFRRFPVTQRVERAAFWALCDVLALGLVDVPAIGSVVERIARRHLRRQVPDATLRATVTPDYAVGCKRGLFSNDYLPALGRPNVDVVTSGIAEVLPNGIRTADGTVHEVDVIIYGTGFAATEFLGSMRVHGREGRKLADVWSDGAHAYLGMAVSGFPNLFLMYGPNTNLGVGSIVYMLEAQARYIGQAVRGIAGNGGAMDVREDVAAAYDRRIQARLARSVWTRCSSWYRTASGRVTNNWPGTVTAYGMATRRMRPSDYQRTAR